MTQVIPFGPRAGSAMNVTMMSYDGMCTAGVNADPAAVADLDGLTAELQAGLDEVIS